MEILSKEEQYKHLEDVLDEVFAGSSIVQETIHSRLSLLEKYQQKAGVSELIKPKKLEKYYKHLEDAYEKYCKQTDDFSEAIKQAMDDEDESAGIRLIKKSFTELTQTCSVATEKIEMLLGLYQTAYKELCAQNTEEKTWVPSLSIMQEIINLRIRLLVKYKQMADVKERIEPEQLEKCNERLDEAYKKYCKQTEEYYEQTEESGEAIEQEKNAEIADAGMLLIEKLDRVLSLYQAADKQLHAQDTEAPSMSM